MTLNSPRLAWATMEASASSGARARSHAPVPRHQDTGAQERPLAREHQNLRTYGKVLRMDRWLRIRRLVSAIRCVLEGSTTSPAVQVSVLVAAELLQVTASG